MLTGRVTPFISPIRLPVRPTANPLFGNSSGEGTPANGQSENTPSYQTLAATMLQPYEAVLPLAERQALGAFITLVASTEPQAWQEPRNQKLLELCQSMPAEERALLLDQLMAPNQTNQQRFEQIETTLNAQFCKNITFQDNANTNMKAIGAGLSEKLANYNLRFPPLTKDLGPVQTASEMTAKRFNAVMRLFHSQGITRPETCFFLQDHEFQMFLTAPVPQTEWVPAALSIFKGPAHVDTLRKRIEAWEENRLWEESEKPQPDPVFVKWVNYFEPAVHYLRDKTTERATDNPKYILWHRLAGKSSEAGHKAFNNLLNAIVYDNQLSIPKNMFELGPIDDKPKILFKLLPHLLFQLDPHQLHVDRHMRRIEGEQYGKIHADWHHPNEAEMMMLLRHPKDPKRDHVDPMVKALTATYDHLKHGVKDMSDTMIKLWSDIGAYSHGFLYWKYDARGGKDSMLSQFGASPLKGANTEKWGKGYVVARYTNPLLPLSPQTTIALYQPFMAVTHPDFGTLLIRNSSDAPNSGRTKLRHAAYWSDATLSMADIAKLNPDRDERFKSVLDHRLYHPTPKEKHPEALPEDTREEVYPNSPQPIQHYLGFLLGQLDILRGEYSRWKFDTGVDGKPGRRMNSDGFMPLLKTALGGTSPDDKILDLLENPVESGEKRTLAFVNPNYPPWASIPFESRKGMQYRYDFTPAHRYELQAMFEGSWPKTREGLKRIDFYNFLQAGISAGAELIILSDNKPSHGGTSHGQS